MNIGIIGTAGRGDSVLTNEVYQKAGKQFLNIIKAKAQFEGEITLISGGAAGIDFLAVSIFLRQKSFKLRLHLPAMFNEELKRFEGGTSIFDPANICNYYHKEFSKVIGRNSLCEMASAIESGAYYSVSKGFKERNTKVAEESDVLLAATFGDGPNLKRGGTFDTWEKFVKAKPHNQKFHLDLNTNQLYTL